MSRARTIGVLGGMGPAATWDFCARLARLAPAERDQDHPRVLVDCDGGVPDRTAAMAGTGPSPAPRLEAMARGLERAGAELLCMPCNAAHAWADAVRAATALPLVDMIEATVARTRALAPGATRVAVLATDATRAAGLYERAFGAHGLEVLPTREQERLMAIIAGVKRGDVSPGAREATRTLARGLIDAGAGAVVGACTEVPLLLAEGDLEVPVVASSEALARATIRSATGAAAVGP